MIKVDALFREGLAFQQQGKLASAETRYAEVLRNDPDHAGALHFLGCIHLARKDHAQALTLIEKSLSLCQTKPAYYNNYGILLKEMGRLKEAIHAFRDSVQIDPQSADAWANLGAACLARQQYRDAEKSLDQALKIAPKHAEALKHRTELHFQQGRRYSEAERFDKARAAFHLASISPCGKSIWQYKHLGFCPSVFPDEASIEAFWSELHEKLDQTAEAGISMDWRTLPVDGFFPSFILPHLGKPCRDIREKFCSIFQKAFDGFSPPGNTGCRGRGKCRLGFHVFSGHEGGFLRGTSGIIEGLNRNKYQLFVFATDKGLEYIRKKLQIENVVFVPLQGDFVQMVKTIRECDCDLIYYRKAGSDPWSYFFPFARCATVQVTSYGTHGTSGNRAIDYFLSSEYVEPPDGDRFYTEALYRLNAMPTFQKPVPLPHAKVSRDEFSLPATGALYFFPHRIAKYHPLIDTVFEHIAARDPDGHFVLLTGKRPVPTSILQKRLEKRFKNDVLKRFVLIPALRPDRYYRLLSLATVLLDSPVYAGGLTSFDAFSYGVPEVTLSGSLHVQNFASGIYRKMGMDCMPCDTLDEYLDLAVRLGTDKSYRAETSEEILERNHAIFGNREVIDEHERFFDEACGNR